MGPKSGPIPLDQRFDLTRIALIKITRVLVRCDHILDKLPDIVGVKYWEIIADNLSKAAWSLGR